MLKEKSHCLGGLTRAAITEVCRAPKQLQILGSTGCLGVPTTPAFELTTDQTNSRFYFRQRVRSDGGFQHQVSYGVTALGTNLATAFVIINPMSFFSTVASGTGCALPAATTLNTGIEYVIWNQGGNTLTIYAQTGETINGGASITVATSAYVRLIAATVGLWMRVS
jgi:hypothetical protein